MQGSMFGTTLIAFDCTELNIVVHAGYTVLQSV
jgi:hypothetical protein